MAREIERKFIINKLPENLEKYPNSKISQGYLIITEHMEIRLRSKDGLFYQTVKTGSGLNRNEYEIELAKDQFDKLWALTKGNRVNKTRYDIDFDNYIIELDIYEGDLSRLVTAEVEFTSDEVSNNFEPPDWFGEDITLDKRYKNQSLALKGIPD